MKYLKIYENFMDSRNSGIAADLEAGEMENDQIYADMDADNFGTEESQFGAEEILAKWEEALVQTKAQSNDDIINYINKLSADYIFLKGDLDSNIPFTTKGQEDQYKYLDVQWKALKKQMQDLVNNDIAELNKLCKEKDIAKIIVGL